MVSTILLPNFNSSKVRLEPMSQLPEQYRQLISIPVRYDWNCDKKLYHVIGSVISIPVRYDWNLQERIKHIKTINNFNSSKVRLEPCGHKCGLCLCITWLLWQRYDKNREKNVDVGKLISDGAMTTVFQRGTMLSKNSNINFHEQY